MNKITQNIVFSVGALAIFAVVLIALFSNFKADTAFGSVTMGNEYHASTTKNFAGATMPNLSVLNTGPGALGSVVITGAGAGTINIYDATSTVTNTGWPTTTIATIPASAAAGTYTFDVIYQKGLLIEILGAYPTSTITYR
jgi:hypothetical protein